MSRSSFTPLGISSRVLMGISTFKDDGSGVICHQDTSLSLIGRLQFLTCNESVEPGLIPSQALHNLKVVHLVPFLHII